MLSRDSARSLYCTLMYSTYNLPKCKIHTYVLDPGILRVVVCVTIELIIHQSRDHGGRRPHRLLWATESVVRHISPVVCMVINNSVAY